MGLHRTVLIRDVAQHTSTLYGGYAWYSFTDILCASPKFSTIKVEDSYEHTINDRAFVLPSQSTVTVDANNASTYTIVAAVRPLLTIS
jgi:hypothetical protein